MEPISQENNIFKVPRKNNFQNKYKLPFKNEDKVEVFSLKDKTNNKTEFLTIGSH